MLLRFLSRLLCLFVLSSSVSYADPADRLMFPVAPKCSGYTWFTYPQPKSFRRLGKLLQRSADQFVVADMSQMFMRFRIETKVSECIHKPSAERFQYQILIPHARFGVSTAPQQCDPRAETVCRPGALSNINIVVFMSSYEVARNESVMLRWVAVQAACYVRLSQILRNGNVVDPNLVERCVLEAVGPADHYEFYLAGGYNEAEAGVYLARLREEYELPW